MNEQNTPPHASLTLEVYADLRVTPNGLENALIKAVGCHGCLASAMGDYAAKNPAFFFILTQAFAIACKGKFNQSTDESAKQD